MATPIIHPHLTSSLRAAGWFSQSCTITERVEPTPTNSLGQPIPTYLPVAALTDIPCAKSPASAIERQAAAYTVTDNVWLVLLDGHYPEITTAMQAVIDGEVFDIDAVESDQTASLTRLRVRSVEV